MTSFLPALLEDLFPETVSNKGVRVYEESNQLHVEMPLPGLKPENIEVSLNKGVLMVRGKMEEEQQDKKRKFYRSSKREYSYSMVLPAQIDEKQEPQANYENGILKISMPVAKQSETKKISVKTGNSNKQLSTKK